jgi:hypothetical protein
MSVQAARTSACHDPVISVLSGLFGVFLGIAVALALSLFIVPFDQYLSICNYLQIITAFAGAAAFLTLYFRYGHGIGLLYAAGALALWGIADIAWYVAVFFGAGTFTFPSLIDMGFVAAILLLSSAYNRIYPRKQVPGIFLLAILVLVLIVPLAILATQGITGQALMILLYFFACGSLIITGLNHSLPDHPMALAGTLLFALAFMIYPIRETFFVGNPYLSIIGTFVAAGFSLIVLGFLPSAPSESQVEPAQAEPPRGP